MGLTENGNAIAYSYDADGNRISKTVNGITTEYILIDGTLTGQITGQDKLVFLYDESGTKYGFTYNGATYYYNLNLQGDVIGIFDSTGTEVVQYAFDEWGKLLSVTGQLASTVGQINPIRYRGYYYDAETGFYYVSSRYYDPEIGRFLNADNQLSTGSDLTGMNLFAYCGNNPVNRIDPDGHAWKDIKNWFSNTWNKVKTTAKQVAQTVKNKLTKNHYEERTKKNGTHPTYDQVVSSSSWTKVSKDQTKYHDNGIGKAELKYTNKDGREAVFDGDTLQPMTDPRYIATYNFCPIQQLPDNPVIKDYVTYGITMAGHAWKDVIPYYIWGNSPEDTTTFKDRILLSF